MKRSDINTVIRKGTFEELKKENGKIYAEKILITGENQITLTHFHYQEMEGIINRGGPSILSRRGTPSAFPSASTTGSGAGRAWERCSSAK